MLWSDRAALRFLGPHPASIGAVRPAARTDGSAVIIRTPVSSREIGVLVIREEFLQFLQRRPGLLICFRVQVEGGELVIVQHRLRPVGSHPQVEPQVHVESRSSASSIAGRPTLQHQALTRSSSRSCISKMLYQRSV